jgi:hypothetical protein
MNPLEEVSGLTAKEAWWAGARAALGLDASIPRQDVVRIMDKIRLNKTPVAWEYESLDYVGGPWGRHLRHEQPTIEGDDVYYMRNIRPLVYGDIFS